MLAAAGAGASGFSAPEPGVKAMGMAGAVTARADDPTAGFFNPGALVLVKKGKLTAGGAGEYLNQSAYQGLPPGIGAGTAGQQARRLSPFPHVFALKALGPKLKVGAGAYTPFAFQTEWSDPDTFAGRELTTRSQLQTYDVDANFSYLVTPSFGIGAGVIYRSSKLSMGRRTSAFEPDVGPVDVGSLAIDTDWDNGTGWDAGFLLKPSSGRFSLGASFRSAIDITYHGAGTLTQIETGDAQFDALNRAALPYGVALPLTSAIAFPATANLGIGFAPSEKLWLEVDVTRTAWSRFQGLTFAFSSEPGFSRTVQQGPWKDTLSYRLGVQLEMAKGILLRLGYALEQTPQPDASLAPFLPDADRSVLCAGFGRDWLDVAFQYVLPKSRTTLTNADALNGTYSGSTYRLAVSITKK
ncbi:MAG TPA: outer membrane protein transport protein [Thermoanaerobaculia bacterium]|jgi:long-chain fatty acid transport protein